MQPEPENSSQRILIRENLFASFLLSCAVVTLLFGLLFGQSSIWDGSGPLLLTNFRTYVLTAAFGSIAFLIGRGRKFHLTISPFLLALIAWFFLDALTRPYSWFHGLSIRGEILVSGCIGVFLLLKAPTATLRVLCAFSILLPVIAFLSYSQNKLLISDDHASFYYRLLLLKDHLPHIPFYNTDWNGGYDARDFFATGALNVYPLFAILSPFVSDPLAYKLTAIWIAFLLPALSMFAATKIITRDSISALIAATLATASGLIWFRWSLLYGTLGFCTSAALFPLVAALTWRAIHDPSALSRKRDIALFCILWTLFFLWPGSMFMCIPVALYGLAHYRAIFQNRKFLIAAALILLINLPWMVLFSKVSQVSSFISVSKTTSEQQTALQEQKKFALGARGVSGNISVEKSVKSLRENAGSTNPLVLLLLIPGIVFAPKAARYFLGGSIVYLLVVGTVIAPLKPHLELERMVLVGFMLAALPAGIALTEIISRLHKHFSSSATIFRRCAAAMLVLIPIGMLCASPFVTASVSTNRSILKFHLSGEIWDGIAKVFADYGSSNGRILFSGFLLHELDGGHAAPLPAITGAPAVASSQFHNLWAYRQVFPKSYLEREDIGIVEYLNTMNIGGIFAHEKQWRNYFAARPTEYQLEENIGRFAFYRRVGFASNYVLAGAASKLSITRDTITLTPTTESVTLKFNYLDFLQSSGCVIKGEQVAPEITLIRLERCTPGTEITIRSISTLGRLLN